MPLRTKNKNGIYYIEGTVRAGKSSVRVRETTGIRASERGAKKKAEEVRLNREHEIQQELLYGKSETHTWMDAAFAYSEKRRIIMSKSNIRYEQDANILRVVRISEFFAEHGIADKPLSQFTKEDVQLYFNYCMNELNHAESTLDRAKNQYCAVMNTAVENGWITKDFPKPDIPQYELPKRIYGKTFTNNEIKLFLKYAPPHFRPILALGFATGQRVGELLLLNKKADCTKRIPGITLSDHGRERIYLGKTKNKQAHEIYIPAWAVREVNRWLDHREKFFDKKNEKRKKKKEREIKDDFPELFLTDKYIPYKVPKQQSGTLFKNAWNSTKKKVVEALIESGKYERAEIVSQATPHWVRHNAASKLFEEKASDREVMEHMGWTDPRIPQRYNHNKPEHNNSMANKLSFGLENFDHEEDQSEDKG